MRFAKIAISFLRVHELDIVLGVNTDHKSHVGKVCSPKKFFEFWEPVKVRNTESMQKLKESVEIKNKFTVKEIERARPKLILTEKDFFIVKIKNVFEKIT